MIIQLIVKRILSVRVKTTKYGSNVYLDEGELAGKLRETSEVKCKFVKDKKGERKKKDVEGDGKEGGGNAVAWQKKRGEKEKSALLAASVGGTNGKIRSFKKKAGEKENKITNYAKKAGPEVIDLIDTDDEEEEYKHSGTVEDDAEDFEVEVDKNGWQTVPREIMEGGGNEDDDNSEAEFDDDL